MIDDELLQELLAKASGLYNNGDYHGAIAAWKEALTADPSSQKAREGIQMATLLLGDWDPRLESADGPEPAAAADGAEASHARLTPEERAARLDDGVARVRTLLRQRQYSAAIEGARSLVPIDPDSDEVQRLVEDAQQAFESAPFIEEHLTLARELAAQERLSEAEVECRKVFVLDPANPDALALAAALRARMEAPEGASSADGVTMRMEIADLMAAQERAGDPDGPGGDEVPAPAEKPEGGGTEADAAIAASLPDDLMDFDLETFGAAAVESMQPAAPPAQASDPMPEAGPDQDPGMSALDQDGFDLEPQSPETPATDRAAEEIVDAETVVPPAVRLVPRTGGESESVEALLEKTEDVISIPMAPPAAAVSPSPAATPAGPIGWEEELESLNIKTGEHDIVGRSASLNTTPATPSGGEMDLSSLLGDDNDDVPGRPEAAPPSAAGLRPASRPHEESPLDDLASGLADEMIGGGTAIADEATAVPADAPDPEPQSVPAAPPRQRPRLSVPPIMFAVLGVVILAGAGAVWWFFYQPKTAAAQVSAPPAGDPPADRATGAAGAGPIPTPLGSTSRQPAQTAGNDASVAALAATPGAPETAPGAAPGAAPADTRGAVEPAPAPAPARPSPEVLRREATRHLADGRRLMAAEKWQEARGELAAALALDPVNFECKEMLDQVQAKVDEEVKVTRDLDEARRAFADKDYQGALWKLYRLPRDPRLGTVDVYIRNAWFNWAVVGLKGGDAVDARQKLTEVLTADPADAEAKKMLDVAERYSSRAKDRVFYSFTDSLRFRTFDQK